MKTRIFSCLFALLISITVQAKNFTARSSAKSKAEFCEGRKDVHYFANLAHNPENMMTLENQGGIFNGGVCWWHSLFQRSSIYLTVYRPELAKPDRNLAKKIIHAIAAGKRVIEIPGYNNFKEFTLDWNKEIQSKLEAWQLEDGALKWAWIEGLSGSTTADPSVIAKTLNFVVQRAEDNGALEYTMWQFPGITAHASINIGGWNKGNTYGVTHLDSNFPQKIKEYVWAPPARAISTANYSERFMAYVYRRSDLNDFKKAGDQYCASRSYDHDFFYEPLKNTLE